MLCRRLRDYTAPMRAPALVAALIVAALVAPSARADRLPARKPSAPVSVSAIARYDAGRWWITVDARATRDVTSLEVVLPASAQSAQFSYTPTGSWRRHEFPVVLRDAGMDVTIAVRVQGAFGVRTHALTVRVGAPAVHVVHKPAQTVRLTDGREIADVRETP